MGQSESSEIKVTDAAQIKLMGFTEPLPNELEKQDMEGLDKLRKMDEENTKKLELTTEKFYEYYNSLKQNSSVLEMLDVPIFEEERAEIIKSFENKEKGKEEGDEEDGEGEEKEKKERDEKEGEEEEEEEEERRKADETGKYERREKAFNNYSEAVKEALDRIVSKSKDKQKEDEANANKNSKK